MVINKEINKAASGKYATHTHTYTHVCAHVSKRGICLVVATLPAEMECTNTDTHADWQTIDKHSERQSCLWHRAKYKRLIVGLGASHYEVDTNIKEINNGLPRYLLVTGFSVPLNTCNGGKKSKYTDAQWHVGGIKCINKGKKVHWTDKNNRRS